MYFRKQPHIGNFEFATQYKGGARARIGRENYGVHFTAYGQDVYRLRLSHSGWGRSRSQAGLTPPARRKPASPLVEVQPGLALHVRAPDGTPILSSTPGHTFGVCGRQSVFVFNQADDHQFYGLGEKMRGLELSGQRTKFWNTDIFADFDIREIEAGRPDPMYVSIPYVIVKRGNYYCGLLLDNPYATFLSTSAPIAIGGNQMMVSHIKERYLTIGAEHGQPDLYLIVGPSLGELTRKLQTLVGRTPLPPVWALGYQQCRWGYRSAACLDRIDKELRRHQIPCDGIWLDIEYMNGYRVFTFDKKHFPRPAAAFKALRKKGRQVVPIIDPGVKQEPGYAVYESGRKANAFCKTAQGTEFIGMVWPGETVFPDFSLPKARAWWADQVQTFAEQGLQGAWLDMNDPSTGHVDPTAMRFNHGRESHYTFHNQYALGMARATRDGFTAAHPQQRPFLLTRSAYTGISKYAAVWTGDNVSNYHYLRNTIAVSLNLALSGVPFNGPDIGGFAYSATGPLVRDWMKAGFLFPFCRNHTALSANDQEPWVFGAPIRRIITHYIRLRYKLRPYLYNLFIQQALSGEAIMRPLFYDFADNPAQPLGNIDDQFMCGPAIMHAPLLDEGQTRREVVLPGPATWYSPLQDAWIEGGQTIEVTTDVKETPLFFRAGQGVAMHPGNQLPTDNAFDGRTMDLHCFLPARPGQQLTAEYYADDGESLAYQKGVRSRLRVAAVVEDDGTLRITAQQLDQGFGPIQCGFVVYDRFPSVYINDQRARKTKANWTLAGRRVTAFRYTGDAS